MIASSIFGLFISVKSAYYCEKSVTKLYAKNLHKFEFISAGENES